MEKLKRLIEYFQNFTVLDLLAFGNILQVEELDDFTDYMTNILEAFQKQPRYKRKELLKLAKEVSKENIENRRAAATNLIDDGQEQQAAHNEEE